MITNDVLKPMVIEVGDKTYTLEFNRNSVASAERAGLDLNRITTEPMNMIPLLFFAAFKMHQPFMTREETDKILFDELNGLTAEEVRRLGELYAAPTNALMNSGEGERKNARISL